MKIKAQGGGFLIIFFNKSLTDEKSSNIQDIKQEELWQNKIRPKNKAKNNYSLKLHNLLTEETGDDKGQRSHSGYKTSEQQPEKSVKVTKTINDKAQLYIFNEREGRGGR